MLNLVKNANNIEVEHSAKISEAYDFISHKPKKFDEIISEGGTNVYGGQKQRLSIGIAIVRRPKIYIFDDSFSALDFKTDAILRSKLKMKQGSTLFLKGVVFIIGRLSRWAAYKIK